MTNLYLIRHGAYIGTDDSGSLIDGGLSEEGIRQAEKLRERLKQNPQLKPDVLISSTLPRARQTAAIIAPVFELPVIARADIEEWRNTNKDTTKTQFLDRVNAVSATEYIFQPVIADTETKAEFLIRACTALRDIIDAYRDKMIVMVCHGGIIEAAYAYFNQHAMVHLPPVMLYPNYTSITHWCLEEQQTPERWLLVRLNDTRHLDDEL